MIPDDYTFLVSQLAEHGGNLDEIGLSDETVLAVCHEAGMSASDLFNDADLLADELEIERLRAEIATQKFNEEVQELRSEIEGEE